MQSDEEAPIQSSSTLGIPATIVVDKKAETKEKEDVKPPPSFTKLLSLGKPEFKMLMVAVVLMVVAESTGLLNPILIANAYNALVDPNNTDRMSEIN